MIRSPYNEINFEYQQLDETKFQKNHEPLTKTTKMEEVLIYLNSFNNKFQIEVISIFCFFFFFIGMHIFTVVYLFLSPNFYSKAKPYLGKTVNRRNYKIRGLSFRAFGSTRLYFYNSRI